MEKTEGKAKTLISAEGGNSMNCKIRFERFQNGVEILIKRSDTNVLLGYLH